MRKGSKIVSIIAFVLATMTVLAVQSNALSVVHITYGDSYSDSFIIQKTTQPHYSLANASLSLNVNRNNHSLSYSASTMGMLSDFYTQTELKIWNILDYCYTDSLGTHYRDDSSILAYIENNYYTSITPCCNTFYDPEGDGIKQYNYYYSTISGSISVSTNRVYYYEFINSAKTTGTVFQVKTSGFFITHGNYDAVSYHEIAKSYSTV